MAADPFDRKAAALAASESRLAAAVLAAPAVDNALDLIHFVQQIEWAERHSHVALVRQRRAP